MRFVDLQTGRVRRASGRHRGAVTAARFTPDGRSLVTTSEDGDAILWAVGAGAASETLQGHANGITALQVSGDGRTLYTAGSTARSSSGTSPARAGSAGRSMPGGPTGPSPR